MSTLLDRLESEPVLLADGAWGSHFIEQGIDLSREPADSWNLRHPGRVSRLAADYASSADILTTNTFGANRVRLARYGLEQALQEINARGVTIAREAKRARGEHNSPLLVAGSMGPARGPGETRPEDAALSDVFEEQAACLAAAGASFLLLETMTDLNETRIAVRAAKAASTLELVCSFAFREREPGHFETWSGDTVESALGTALESGAHLVGANCIPATASILPLVRHMRRFSDTSPLWLKPNAGPPNIGQPNTRGTHFAYPSPLSGAPLDRILDALGCGVIGGCCGTTPTDIGQLRRALERRTKHP